MNADRQTRTASSRLKAYGCVAAHHVSLSSRSALKERSPSYQITPSGGGIQSYTTCPADQPAPSAIGLVTLQGHDSVRLLALLAMPLFALNGRSMRDEPAHILWRLLAVGAFAYFFWTCTALFYRLMGPDGIFPEWSTTNSDTGHTSLFTISTNDLTPLRSSANEPLPLFVSILCYSMTLFIGIALFWLLIKSDVKKQQVAVVQKAKKAASRMRAARRSVAAFGNVIAKNPKAQNLRNQARRCSQFAAGAIDRVRATRATGDRNTDDGAPTAASPRSPRKKGGRGAFPEGLVVAAGVPGSDRATDRSTDPGSPGGGTPQRSRKDKGLLSKVMLLIDMICFGKARRLKKIEGAPWLEPSPGWWSESEAERRARCARNHVRTMLRGRKSYAVYKKREGESFFYPQRLWMAFSLSIWIQLIIALFFGNIVRWVGAALHAAQDFDRKVTSESQYHAAIDEAERFAPVFRLFMLLLWAVAAPSGRGAIIHTALAIVSSLIPILGFLVLLGNWLHVMMLYKRRVLELRRGVYFFDRLKYREDPSNQYIGFQIAGMTLSGFFFMAGGVALAVSITLVAIALWTTTSGYTLVTNAASLAFLPALLSIGQILVTMVFQIVVNRNLFFVGPAKTNNRWLRYRYWCAAPSHASTHTYSQAEHLSPPSLLALPLSLCSGMHSTTTI